MGKRFDRKAWCNTGGAGQVKKHADFWASLSILMVWLVAYCTGALQCVLTLTGCPDVWWRDIMISFANYCVLMFSIIMCEEARDI